MSELHPPQGDKQGALIQGAAVTPEMAAEGAADETVAERIAEENIRRLIHQLNQPLTAINNYAQAGQHLAAGGLADAAQMMDLFGKIIAQCSRTFVISQQISATLHSKI